MRMVTSKMLKPELTLKKMKLCRTGSCTSDFSKLSDNRLELNFTKFNLTKIEYVLSRCVLESSRSGILGLYRNKF